MQPASPTRQVGKERVLEQLQCPGALLWVVVDAGGDEFTQAGAGHLGQGGRGDTLWAGGRATPPQTIKLWLTLLTLLEVVAAVNI